MTGLRTYARGTAANLVRGIAPALINGLLPIVLVSFLTRDSFSAWSLAMSLTAYVAVFQAGVYQAVTSVAAPKRRTLPTSTEALPLAAALEFLAPLMAGAAVVASLLALFAGRVFPSIPNGLLGGFAAALLLLTAAAICTQLSAAGWGFALGIDRVGRAMTAWTLGRVVSVATTIALAVATHNITLAALGFAVPIAISLPLQLTAVGLNRRDFATALRAERRAYRVLYRRAARALIAAIGGRAHGLGRRRIARRPLRLRTRRPIRVLRGDRRAVHRRHDGVDGLLSRARARSR